MLSNAINWELLERQYLSDTVYRNELMKMVREIGCVRNLETGGGVWGYAIVDSHRLLILKFNLRVENVFVAFGYVLMVPGHAEFT